MESLDIQKVLHDFFTYHGISLENLKLFFNNRIPVAHIKDVLNPIEGLRNIISSVSSFKNTENDIVQDQWAEFILTHMDTWDYSNASPVLGEVNCYLLDKVYFIGNEVTAIDILMYYFLYNIMINFSLQEKEKYLHLSRWFNTIQLNKNARLWREIVPFSRICLYL